jgi:glycosyltransferase involved in cell wall biosynthesis
MFREIPLIDGKAVIVVEAAEDNISFSAPYHSGSKLQFYASLNSTASMCNVAAEIFREFKKQIDPVSVHNYFNFDGWSDPSLQTHHGIDRRAPIGFFLGLPSQVPEFFYKHEITIGAFVCESDRIVEHWVYVCNRLDLVVVPSTFCRNAFLASGVKTPILVVPHGLEAEYQPNGIKQRKHRLVFYNTFYSTSLCHRKSLDELVRCFLKAFDGRTDVVLRLRTDNSTALAKCRETYPFGDLIELDLMTSSLPITEYAQIFSEVHCTVHPSKGEGFGLVPFQSIACETPVIAPHSTGMADYLDNTNSVALKTGKRVAGEGQGNAVGTYLSIDEDHLVDQLRYMADNWEVEYEKVMGVSANFRETYSWPNALSGLTGLVCGLLGEETAEMRQRRLLQFVEQ